MKRSIVFGLLFVTIIIISAEGQTPPPGGVRDEQILRVKRNGGRGGGFEEALPLQRNGGAGAGVRNEQVLRVKRDGGVGGVIDEEALPLQKNGGGGAGVRDEQVLRVKSEGSGGRGGFVPPPGVREVEGSRVKRDVGSGSQAGSIGSESQWQREGVIL